MPPETEDASAAPQRQARGPPAAQFPSPRTPSPPPPGSQSITSLATPCGGCCSRSAPSFTPASGAESAVKSFLEGSASNRSRLAKGEGAGRGGRERERETLVLKGAELLHWLAGVVAKRKAKAGAPPSLPFGVHYPVFGW